MFRNMARAWRWRNTIGGILLVVSIWTYYVFSVRRIKTLHVQNEDDAGYSDDNRLKAYRYELHELMPRLTSNNNASENSKTTTSRKVVLIITQSRSGSSLIGQVLSASKGTMYLHEPLLPFGMDCSSMQEAKLSLLSRLLRCDFDDLREEYENAFKTSHFPEIADCISKGYCNPYASFGLLKGYAAACNWIYFGRATAADFNSQSPSCGFPLKTSILNELCLNSKIISAQITRVCSIKELQNVLDSLTAEGYEVYVIHLIRDPRSTVFSRVVSWNEDPNNTTKEVCKRLRMNLDLLKNTNSGRHNELFSTRIRFEDIFLNTTLWAQKLFWFIGSAIPPELARNIRSYLKRDSKMVNKLIDDERQKTKTNGTVNEVSFTFETMKNAEDEAPQKWRENIPWEMVGKVQQECADVMESLGYTLFKDEHVLRNISVPFFTPSL